MARRTIPSLAYCEYVSTDPGNSIQVNQARLRLIDSIRRWCPEFLDLLSTDVFGFYSQMARQGFDLDQILWSPRISPSDALPQDCPLRSALNRWARHFNADADWLKDAALRTLRGWYVAPEWREQLRWYSMYPHSSVLSTGPTFEFRHAGWETELLSWASYRNLVREQFEETLSNYERATRKLAESRGLVRAQLKYSPWNFDWFVLYQFGGQSSTAIARQWSEEHVHAVDESTVLKGVKAAAKLLAWGELRTTSRRIEPENSVRAPLS